MMMRIPDGTQVTRIIDSTHFEVSLPAPYDQVSRGGYKEVSNGHGGTGGGMGGTHQEYDPDMVMSTTRVVPVINFTGKKTLVFQSKSLGMIAAEARAASDAALAAQQQAQNNNGGGHHGGSN
jgi:hypothetical protein